MAARQPPPQLNRTRQTLRDKHLTELLETGETICPSPLIRRLIYDELTVRGVEAKSRIVGYGKRRSLNWQEHPRPCDRSSKGLIRHKHNGSLRLESVLAAKRAWLARCPGVCVYEKYWPTDEEIARFFDEKVSREEELRLAYRLNDPGPCKYSVVDTFVIEKPIKQMYLVH